MTDKEAVEAIAAIIYEAMRFDRENETPEWQGGNSIAETEARAKAMRVIAAARQHILEEVAREEDEKHRQWCIGKCRDPDDYGTAHSRTAAAIRAAKETDE